MHALQNKVAIIYGAGGIGSTVATAFAAAGAQVHLVGRTQTTLDAVVGDIRAGGGEVHTRSSMPWTPPRCATTPTG